jgi:HPt (histidine-containing phosphotransfer) domain-containing protein
MMNIDRNNLLHLMGGNESLVLKMINSFRSFIENLVSEMELSIRDLDYDNFINQAHNLKNQSSYMGLEQLQVLAVSLETEIEKKNGTEIIDKLVTEIEEEILKIRKSEGWLDAY